MMELIRRKFVSQAVNKRMMSMLRGRIFSEGKHMFKSRKKEICSKLTRRQQGDIRCNRDYFSLNTVSSTFSF